MLNANTRHFPPTVPRGFPVGARLVAVLALTFVGCAPAAQDPRVAVEAAVAAVQAVGGTVLVDGSRADQPVIGVDLAGTAITDAGLQPLASLRQLQVVYLNYTGVTDAGLAALEPLAGLRFLVLEETRVTDASLRHVAAWPHLRVLDVFGTEVTEAGAAACEASRPTLKVYR